MKLPRVQAALRISLTYGIFGGLWILFSDSVLAETIKDLSLLTRIQTYKGWAFVFMSATLIFFLLRRDEKIREGTEQKLRESEENYRSIFENAKEGIFQSTPLGQYVHVNPAMAQIYGYDSPKEMVESIRDISTQIYVDRDDRAKFVQQLENADIGSNFEGRNYRKDGTIFWTSASARSVRDENGKILYYEGFLQDITERKNTEETLRNSEKRFRALIENGLDHISLLDADGNLLWESPSTVETLGYSMNQFVQRNIFQLMHPDDLGWTQELFQKLAQKPGSREKGIFRLRHADGSWRWIEAIATNLLNDPAVNGIVINYRNITERKSAEEAAHKSEERYRTIFEMAPIGIFQSTIDGKFLRANPAMAHMYGYSSPEELLANIADIADQLYSDPSARDEFIRQMDEFGEVRDFETQDLRRDGSRFWSLMTARAVKDSENKVLYYEGFVYDISARKQVEQELRASEERFRQLADNIEEVFWVTDVENGRELYISPAYEKVWGYSRDIVLQNPNQYMESILPEDRLYVQATLARQVSGEKTEMEYRIRHADGTVRWIWDRGFPIFDESGRVFRVAGISADITERKQAEEDLRRSDENLNEAQRITHVGSWELDLANLEDLNSNALRWSDEVFRIFGYQPGEIEVTNENFFRAVHPDDREKIVAAVAAALNSGGPYNIDHRIIRPDGTERIVHEKSEIIFDEHHRPLKMVGTTHDVTENRRAEQALREAELRYRLLVERLPVATYVISSENPPRTTYISPQVQQLWGYSPEEWQADPGIWERQVHPDDLERVLAEDKASFEEQRPFICEYRIYTRDGRVIWLHDETHHVHEPGLPPFSQGIEFDITERKMAEEKLLKSEERFRNIYENMTIGLYHTTPDGRILLNNPALVKMLGFDSAEELASRNLEKDGYIETSERAAFKQRIETEGEITGFESAWARKDGSIIFVRESARVVRNKDGETLYYEGTVEDITERKKAEAEISRHLTELEALYESGLVLSRLLDPEAIGQKTIEILSQKLNWHHATIRLYQPETNTLEVLALGDLGLNAAEISEKIRHLNQMVTRSGQGLSGWVVEHGEPIRVNLLSKDSRYVESYAGMQSGLYVPMRVSQQVIGVIAVESDAENAFSEQDERLLTTLANQAAIAIKNAQLYSNLDHELGERKRAEEMTQRHLNRLNALREIDRVIASSLDLRLTMKLLLAHVTEQLGSDAAAILQFRPSTYSLEYVSERGFQKSDFIGRRIQLGEEYAGTVALELRTLSYPNLRAIGHPAMKQAEFVAKEGFAAYYGIPLVAKGQLKGVLEVYHRAPLESDPEWLDYIETLAGQAAIAMDNIQLFEGVQRSNTELTLAYDETIEGWSRALDLRDKETEGHTKRVTEMTVRLAREFGLSEIELTQIRRGALLHDIGKMGVPDAILLKPDKLTDEEWVLMRKHPLLAYEMLMQIQYLRPALDIPRYHHEKWDGTGYPYGLKGEQIPVAARIFSIVDIWDAVRSDRPYRPAWTVAKAVKYIKGLSGKHLDPQVVKVFFDSNIYKAPRS